MQLPCGKRRCVIHSSPTSSDGVFSPAGQLSSARGDVKCPLSLLCFCPAWPFACILQRQPPSLHPSHPVGARSGAVFHAWTRGGQFLPSAWLGGSACFAQNMQKRKQKKKIFFFVCYVFNSKLKTYALSKFQAPALTPAQSKRTCGNQKAAGWGAASSRPF